MTLRPHLATGLPFSQRARALAQAHTSTFSSACSPAWPSALRSRGSSRNGKRIYSYRHRLVARAILPT